MSRPSKEMVEEIRRTARNVGECHDSYNVEILRRDNGSLLVLVDGVLGIVHPRDAHDGSVDGALGQRHEATLHKILAHSASLMRGTISLGDALAWSSRRRGWGGSTDRSSYKGHVGEHTFDVRLIREALQPIVEADARGDSTIHARIVESPMGGVVLILEWGDLAMMLPQTAAEPTLSDPMPVRWTNGR